MRAPIWLLLLVTATLLVTAGSSDDSTTPTNTQSNSAGLLQGEIGKADFEIRLAATGDENHRRCEGPFVLRGFDMHYDDSLAVLSVNLTITNNSQSLMWLESDNPLLRTPRGYGESEQLRIKAGTPGTYTVQNKLNLNAKATVTIIK